MADAIPVNFTQHNTQPGKKEEKKPAPAPVVPVNGHDATRQDH